MTDQSEIHKMKSEANCELNSIKFKKSKATRNVNQCLSLLEVCKKESQILNSSLLKQSAEDVMTHYNRAQSSLKELEESMDKYLTLSLPTYNNDDEDNLQDMIDEGLAAIDVYSTTSKV